MSANNLFDNNAVIKVIGVGGAGCNAVNRMIESGVTGVEFIAMNTDRQALETNLAKNKISLGPVVTRGMGSGGDPVKGEQAARECEREIANVVEDADMVFITAGMGGGTGTGAAHVVAEIARRAGVLSVAVVTKPFGFEGGKRTKLANAAVNVLEEKVDTLIVLPNDRLSANLDRGVSLTNAFRAADDVLREGVQGISDIVLRPGMVNVDFADVKAVLTDAGRAQMGIGRGKGEKRARMAAEAAAASPMLENQIVGAKRLLVNFTAGQDFALSELQEAMDYINHLADPDEAEIFMGHVFDANMGDEVSITLVAAGINAGRRPAEKDVFVAAAVVTPAPEPVRAPAPVPQPEPVAVATEPQKDRRGLPTDADADDLVLDIPAFLRKHRENRDR